CHDHPRAASRILPVRLGAIFSWFPFHTGLKSLTTPLPPLNYRDWRFADLMQPYAPRTPPLMGSDFGSRSVSKFRLGSAGSSRKHSNRNTFFPHYRFPRTKPSWLKSISGNSKGKSLESSKNGEGICRQ